MLTDFCYQLYTVVNNIPLYIIDNSFEQNDTRTNLLASREPNDDVIFEITPCPNDLFSLMVNKPTISLHLDFDEHPPHQLFLTTQQQHLLFSFIDGKLFVHSLQTRRDGRKEYGCVGIVVLDTITFQIHVTPLFPFYFDNNKERIEITAVGKNGKTHYLTLLNELPNEDVIPGTTLFRAVMHKSKQRRSQFRVVAQENGKVKIQMTTNFDKTAKQIFGQWYLTVYDNEVTFSDLHNSSEFTLRNGVIEIDIVNKVKEKMASGFVVEGLERDTQSFFLKVVDERDLDGECQFRLRDELSDIVLSSIVFE